MAPRCLDRSLEARSNGEAETDITRVGDQSGCTARAVWGTFLLGSVAGALRRAYERGVRRRALGFTHWFQQKRW